MTLYFLMLASLLGHDDFYVRHTATFLLSSPAALPVTSRLLKHPDPEVRRRVEIAYEKAMERKAQQDLVRLLDDLKSQGFNAWPWLDSLPKDWAEGELSHWIKKGKCNIVPANEGRPDWPEYREATRLWLLHRLASGEPYARCRSDLAAMVEGDRRQVQANPNFRWAGK